MTARKIPDRWVTGSYCSMDEGAYLVYWYTDVDRGHQDDPAAYGTVKRWKEHARERFGDDLMFVRCGGRSWEAHVPEEAL